MTPAKSAKDTDTAILDAAFALFSAQGYRPTTTRAIAGEAGVNEVTIFRRFGSKENLFLSVIDREIDISQGEAPVELEPTGDMVEDLTMIGTLMLVKMRERARLIRLVMMEADSMPQLWDTVQRAPNMVRTLLSDYFKKARERGLIRDADPDVVTLAVFSFFFRSLIFHAFWGKDTMMELDESSIREFARIIVEGIRAKDK